MHARGDSTRDERNGWESLKRERSAQARVARRWCLVVAVRPSAVWWPTRLTKVQSEEVVVVQPVGLLAAEDVQQPAEHERRMAPAR